MAAVARRLFLVRRRLGERWALLVLAGLWPLLGMGLVSGPALWRGEMLPLAIVTMFGLTLTLAVCRELWPERGVAPTSTVWGELELGLLLLTATYFLISATGGLRSFLYPLVYALVSFLMVVHRFRAAAAAWMVAVVALEALVGWRTVAREGWALPAYHLTLVGFFAAGNLLVLSSLVRRLRLGHDRQVQSTLERIRQEARDFRLISAALPPESRARSREEEQLRMAHAAVESIHEQVFHNVDLLRSALGLHTCALLWCEDPDPGAKGRRHPKLSIKELSTDSDLVVQSGALEGPGLLAGVLAEPKPLRLRALGGRRMPPYYQGPVEVTDLCALPLLDGGTLRGVLCADRIGDRPFSSEEEVVLAKAAAHILRVVEHERVFSAVERSKYEQEQFYRASELFNEALTIEDVHRKTFEALRRIAGYDLAVITRADDEGREHEVVAVDVPEDAVDGATKWGELAERLGGLRFVGDGSLVGMAIKNRHHMPANGELLDGDTVVFSARTRLRGAHSLLVLPLQRGEQVLGAITLASTRPHRYTAPIREMLRVISHQVGVSVQNARMYQSMEERATTDGLTRLTNRRAFNERFDQLHALAERTGQKYAVILTDIDHFKSVNDTYGHPVGDQVLQRAASVFAGRSRRVDIVARYGGEEFVLVLPDTDGAGAEHFANELRKEIGEMTMTSEHGNFQVTISMGVAEFPADGNDRGELLERADQALYWCKEHGRNCVRRWAQMG
ncbi:MAG: diguanylate cyclase [Myxococcales bacterium]|nr:diguanylate cyclase [Myxococcales bacterium]MCB9713411.1 diguanylate cyclase [Myxococcales bacterium]